MKPAENPILKPLKTPKGNVKGKMAGGGKKSRLSKSALIKTVSLCELPTCRKPFPQKNLSGRLGGRKREFCSLGCKGEFFQLARRIGAALLKRSLTDPEAEKYVKGLLEEIGER